jgi:hypothetical protein
MYIFTSKINSLAPMKTFRKLLLPGLICLALPSFAGEFALLNTTITLTADDNGFKFFYDLNKGPVNWVSPDNYRDGTMYFRYEMISQPGDDASYFSFDIWGDHDGSYYTESAAPLSAALNGAGSVSTFSATPSTFYARPGYGPVDFTDRTTFWRWGVCHWFSKNPNYLLAPYPSYSDDPQSQPAWETNYLWLPVTIKVTVVAVSQGSVFSGWDNYTGGCTPVRQPTPTYGIDYVNHTTDKVVPSTDEYSYNSDMSGAVSGTGVKLALTLGQDVYFRTKSSGECSLASDVQHLDVPDTWTCTPVKQPTPTYGIDYVNHTTDKVVPSTDEYSYNSNMSGAVSGTGVKLALTAGQDVYFRTKASGECYLASDIQYLDVPSSWGGCVPAKQATPTYAIDFYNETTDKIVPSTDEYSIYSTMDYAVSGTGSKVTFLPGQTLYFRTKWLDACHLASNIQTLYMPARPAKPSSSYTIDFINEKTVENVPATIEYAASSSFTGAATGTGVPVSVIPGGDLYYRVKATSSLPCSEANHLAIPSRPAAPSAFTIDYINERTNQAVSSGMEYSTSPSMSSPVAGTNAAVSVTPATDLYIRYKSTASQFSSAVQTLDVPDRPDAPSFAINYMNEETDTPITSEYEYAYSPDMTGSASGSGGYLHLTPGTDIYFRKPATSGSFRSPVQTLAVPSRPAAPSFAIDYINENTTAAVAATIEYSSSSDYTAANTGTSIKISLNPGTDLYFRVKATSGSFASGSFLLEVPARPAAPEYHIDFVNEQTSEAVLSATEYSSDPAMTDPQFGTGSPLLLVPGNDYYFRLKSTSSSFAGEVSHLAVPARPILITAAGDTITNNSFAVAVTFPYYEATGFEAADVEVSNAEIKLTGSFAFSVTPVSYGEVSLLIKANAVIEGNFASEKFVTYYKQITQTGSAASETDRSLTVYPNPVDDRLTIKAEGSLLPAAITLYDENGTAIMNARMQTETFVLEMNDVLPGLYILKVIDSRGNVTYHKFFRQHE